MNVLLLNQKYIFRISLAVILLFLLCGTHLYSQSNWCINNPVFTNLPSTYYLCDASSATLNPGSGYTTYNWSTGATTQTVQVYYSGYYSVTVTNDSGCTGIDTTVVSLISSTVSSINNNICQGSQTSLSAQSTSPNTNCLYFNGVNNYISTSDNFLVTGNTERTFESWIYNSGQSSQGYIFCYGNWTTNQVFALYIDNLNQLKLIIGQTVYTCSNTIPVNGWTQVCVSTDLNNKFRFYINGNFVNSGPITGTYNTVLNGTLNIGRSGNTSAQGYFNGKLDEIRFWSKALEATESQSYLYLHMNHGIDSHLVRYWDCNSISGTNIYDMNGIQGTLNGTTLSSTTPFASYQYMYHWSTGETGSSLSLVPTQTTTFILYSEDGITSCSDSIQITVVSAPSLPDTLLLCNYIQDTLNAGTGYSSYHWSNGSTTQNIIASGTGAYSVTVTGQGCTFTHSSYLNFLNVHITEPDTTICNGTGIVLHGSSSSSAYEWSTGQSTSDITVSPLLTTIYYLTTSNSVNTCYDSIEVHVTPAISINLPPTEFSCNNNILTVTVPNPVFSNYHWNSGQTTSSIVVNTTGLYIITVTDSYGCSKSDSTMVTMYNISIVQSDTTTCDGLPIVLSVISNNPGVVWSNGMTGMQITVNPAVTTTYTATLSGGGNTCSDHVTITVGPPINVNLPDTLFTCSQSFLTLDVTSPSASYSWSNGETTSSIQVNNSGPYSVTVTNTAGCMASAESIVSVIYASLYASATNICPDSLIFLTTNSSGYYYYWNTGDTTPVIFEHPVQSAIYFVTISDSYSSCVYSQPVLVYPVNTGIIYGPETVYADTTVTYYVNPHAGSVYSWFVSGGYFTPSVTDSITVTWGYGDTGYVSVTETNINGCTGQLVELYVHITFHIGITENQMKLSFDIRPNPSSDRAEISLPEDDCRGKLSIFDLTGHRILDLPENGELIILDDKQFEKGVYLVRHSGKTTMTARMIVL